jgi:uncharacterized protein
MESGSPDLVDCMLLAERAAALHRVYDLADLPRIQDLLSERSGVLAASFAFYRAESGRAAARVRIEARPTLRCQRCLGGFGVDLHGDSDVEFADSDSVAAQAPEREFYIVEQGLVAPRELAEEELLLALPIAASCSEPERCGQVRRASGETVRPFGALRDLLKNT